jgi:hypothetical protein
VTSMPIARKQTSLWIPLHIPMITHRQIMFSIWSSLKYIKMTTGKAIEELKKK